MPDSVLKDILKSEIGEEKYRLFKEAIDSIKRLIELIFSENETKSDSRKLNFNYVGNKISTALHIRMHCDGDGDGDGDEYDDGDGDSLDVPIRRIRKIRSSAQRAAIGARKIGESELDTVVTSLEAIKNTFLTQRTSENLLELTIQVLRVIRTDITTQYGQVAISNPNEIESIIDKIKEEIEKIRECFDLVFDAFEESNELEFN